MTDYFGSVAYRLRQMFPYSETRDGRLRQTNLTQPLRNSNKKVVIEKQYAIRFL